MPVDLIPPPAVEVVEASPEPPGPAAPTDPNRRTINGREVERSCGPGGSILFEEVQIIPERIEERPTGKGAVATTKIRHAAKRGG